MIISFADIMCNLRMLCDNKHNSDMSIATPASTIDSWAAVLGLSSWVQCSLKMTVVLWLHVQSVERLFIPAYICIIIRSELCQLWASALLRQLMKQQEHALLTHDALRAWELCGSEILRALLIGHDNRKWHQLRAQETVGCKFWESDDCSLWWFIEQDI